MACKRGKGACKRGKEACKRGKEACQLALAGVAVAPTDEVDSTREYELVAIG